MRKPRTFFSTVLTLTAIAAATLLSACAIETTSDSEELRSIEQEAVISQVSFRTPSGRFLGAQNNGGGAVIAQATAAQAWEKFAVDDFNGGSLQSGDSVFIRAGNGQYFMAQSGGGSTLTAASNNRLGWETFRVVKKSGSGAINNGDIVGLQTQNGQWVSAINGGGSGVTAGGTSLRAWEEFAISGLSTTSQPSSPLGSILSENQFNQLFNRRNSFYTYAGLLEAAKLYPAFATSGDTDTRKREVAAFLANVTHETGDLVYVEEINKGDYCSTASWVCRCEPGKRYFGRGPIQISWNYNYCAASQSIFGDPEVLRKNPELVAQEPWLAWATAMWFWMTQTGAGTMTAHNAMVNQAGFGETIRTINGSLECNGGNWNTVQTRIGYYQEITNLFGVNAGGNLGC